MREPAPDLLFEITARSLTCVSPRTPSEQRQELIPERGLEPSPVQQNILHPDLYSQALPRVAQSRVSKRQTAALVIPDYATRMAIVDFENFPADEEERNKLLRFRLRKSVPFPIDEAQVSHSVQSSKANNVEVLVAAIAKPVLEEYQSIFTAAGYRLGLVLPSSVAAIPLCTRGGDAGLTLFAKAAGSALSVILLSDGNVNLVRSLDLSGDQDAWEQPSGEAVMPLLQQTLAYAEDTLGRPVTRLVLCGFGPMEDSLGQLAELEFGITYMPARSRYGIASRDTAGLLGLLEQYAA